MKKLLLSAALLFSLGYNTQAQAVKTKTKTTTGTSTAAPAKQTVTETTYQETSSQNNAGGSSQQSEGSSSGNGGIKASSGDITLEANVNILGNNVNLSNSLNQVRVRYFLSDDMAARLGAHLSFNTNVPAADTKTRAIEFSVSPGIEKHFAGTNRLSPYLGAELVLGIRSAHSEVDGPGNSSVEVKGSFGAGDNANRGFFLVGVGAVGGFDFYVAKHLYMGYELSMELSNRSFSEIETITTDGGGTVTTNKNKGSSALTFGPNVRNGIRVGFIF